MQPEQVRRLGFHDFWIAPDGFMPELLSAGFTPLPERINDQTRALYDNAFVGRGQPAAWHLLLLIRRATMYVNLYAEELAEEQRRAGQQ